MPVPLLDLKEQNLELEAALTDAFQRILRSGHYIMGPELDRFEVAAAQALGVKHALGVSSGTDAILLALMALGIGPGDEIIVPSFTFFATAGCVARLGATPIFADVCPVCFNLHADEITRLVTPRTKAVMPVHLFGQAADMDAILATAAKHGLRVIEDAAQAFGSTYNGKPVGGLGDFGTYSFFPSKNLGGLGDSGLLVTQDDALADRARLLRVHGARPKYYHHAIGANFRMDPLQAAFLAAKLPMSERYCASRNANAAEYTQRLSRFDGVVVADADSCARNAGSLVPAKAAAPRLILPVVCAGRNHIWNQFTVRVTGPGRRDALRQHLTERGIGSEIYYPVPLHLQPCFTSPGKSPAPLPVSEALAGEVMSLPIYPELKQAQRDEVVGAIKSFLHG